MALTVSNHAIRDETSRAAAKAGKDLTAADVKGLVEKTAAVMGLEGASLTALWEEWSKDPQRLADLLSGGAFGIIAWILSFVTGLSFSAGQLDSLVTGANNEEKRRALGQILTDLYAETLKTERAAQGWLSRTPGDSELENFRQLSGAAMRLSLADILIDWAGEAIPLGLAKGLKGIAEKINDAVALDDALEEVVQVPMQAVIQRGLEAKYNRELKPQDFTESEARNALLQERIAKDVYDKVLDNQGVRDDIRDILLDMQEPNLTESDIDQLYQHNVIDEAAVSEQYKQKGFRPATRELKTKLVVGTRRWKLEEKLFELLGNLYRDGVKTRAEVSPHLQHFGFDPDEEEMWFQIQDLERQQRKWLSSKQIEDLVGAGLLDPGFAIDYQVKQGMTGEDASLLYMQSMLARYQPTPQNDLECFKIIEDAFSLNKMLAALLSRLPVLDPTGTLNTGDFQKLLECLINKAKTP